MVLFRALKYERTLFVFNSRSTGISTSRWFCGWQQDRAKGEGLLWLIKILLRYFVELLMMRKYKNSREVG